MDDRVFLTPEATKTVVAHCNSGRLNRAFYKKDGTTLGETYDRIHNIKKGMRDLVDTMCATIRRRVVAVAEVAEQLVGVPVYPQPLVAASLDDAQQLVDAGAPSLDESPRIVAPNLFDAHMQHLVSAALGVGQLHLLDAGAPSLDEPMQPVAASLDAPQLVEEPMQIDAPRRFEERLGAPPAAKVTLGASSILAMEAAEIFVECDGKQLALPFVTTEMQEVLIGGAAWTTVIIGCKDIISGSNNLTSIVNTNHRLYHGNRDVSAIDIQVILIFYTKNHQWMKLCEKMFTLQIFHWVFFTLLCFLAAKIGACVIQVQRRNMFYNCRGVRFFELLQTWNDGYQPLQVAW
jgi:hypothetical protein